MLPLAAKNKLQGVSFRNIILLLSLLTHLLTVPYHWLTIKNRLALDRVNTKVGVFNTVLMD
jgi:hypothetical protein